jgi:hypothetical protein
LDCEHKGKHPHTQHGHNDASTDASVIRAWWEKWPFDNVAFATGGSYFVLDIDPDKGGEQSLADLEAKHGALPPTLTAKSGSGGRHFYFRKSENIIVRSRNALASGIDVRGEGGYVIAAPSVHLSGNRYDWLTDLDTPLADAPEWLLALVKAEAKANTQATPNAGAPAQASLNDVAIAQGHCLTTAQQTQAVGMVLMMSEDIGDLRTHSGAGEGERNATLCRLAGIHLARGESESEIELLALAWATRCDPPYPERDVQRTIHALAQKHDNEREDGRIENDGIGESVANERINSGGAESDGNGESTDESEGNNSFARNAFAQTETQEADAWPTLNADAFHGLAGQIVNAIASETEADAAGILLTLLAAFGNAVGERPHYCYNATAITLTNIHPPSLFVLLAIQA